MSVPARGNATHITLITLRACTRGVCPSVVVVVISMKIARSWDVGIWANCKYDLTVKWGKKKNGLTCFKLTTQARITINMAFYVDHAYRPHLRLTMCNCFLLMHTTTTLYYATMTAERGVCSLESSSFQGDLSIPAVFLLGQVILHWFHHHNNMMPLCNILVSDVKGLPMDLSLTYY